MNECRTIESLIYLYRDGELSADERETVLDHTKTCGRCNKILRQLRSIDAALIPHRECVPVLSGDAALVTDTIRRITSANVHTGRNEENGLLFDFLFGWVRPALSFIVLAAAVLFIAQQSWDARKINALERHLQTVEHPAMLVNAYTNADAMGFLNLNSSSLQNASISSGLLELFKHNNGFFEYLARRYPNLSSITPENGIDERERKILMTEGKLFMKEFEQLLHEGE